MSETEKQYYGYHKWRKRVGPVSQEKMEWWKRIVKLRWHVRGARK